MHAYDQVRSAMRRRHHPRNEIVVEPYYANGDPCRPAAHLLSPTCRRAARLPGLVREHRARPAEHALDEHGMRHPAQSRRLGRQSRGSGSASRRDPASRRAARRGVGQVHMQRHRSDHLRPRSVRARQCQRCLANRSDRSDRGRGLFARLGDRQRSRFRSAAEPPHEATARAADPARQHPGLLRGPGHRRGDPEGGRGPAPRQGPCHGADGRRAGGGRLLQERLDPQPDHHRVAARTARLCSPISTASPRSAIPAPRSSSIGHINDVLLYRELVRRGVSEYLVAPVKRRCSSSRASPTIYTDPETGPVGQVIAFVGAKGGSGSSTVCHNTAFAIAVGAQERRGHRRFRPAVRHRRARLQPGSPPGHRRRARHARAPRRGPARPPAVALLGSSQPVRRAEHARPPLRSRSATLARRCSTSCARTCRGSPSTCRICGPPGRSRSCSGPMMW